MEKLQKAINKARGDRDKQSQREAAAPRGNVAAPRKRKPVHRSTAWEALNPVELDTELLVKNRVVTMTASKAATAFDILRTKVLLQMKENGWKRVAITSPHPGCGKTTTACNLACGITRQPDITGMLFDLDMRQPGVARTLGFRPEKSFFGVLEGRYAFEEQASRVGDNLALGLVRDRRADPTSLLLNTKTAEILDEIEATYDPDLMIFDLPPLLTGDDTRAFLKNVDCALIILRSEVTKISQADVSEQEIAKYTNVLGVVLNSCRHTDESHGYDYYY